jgi:hypothetical protein
MAGIMTMVQADEDKRGNDPEHATQSLRISRHAT